MRTDRRNLQACVLALERPADVRGETVRAILQLAQTQQVLDAVFDGLHVPEHHRRRGVQPEAMGNLHHAQPLVAHALQRSNALAHAVDEDFTAAAGDGSQTSLLKAANHFFYRHLEHVREMVELRWRKTVDVYLGKVATNVLQEVQVVIDAELRMMSALHQYLDATDRHQLLDLLAHLLGREYVRIIVALLAHERAEGAIHIAYVRVVDIAVNNIRDAALRMFPLAHHISQRAQLGECQRVIEPHRFRSRNPLAIEDFALDRIS